MNEPIDSIKAYIQRFFSDDLRHDKTPAGDMERNQLRKWMLQWASDYKATSDGAYLREWALNQPQHWYHQE